MEINWTYYFSNKKPGIADAKIYINNKINNNRLIAYDWQPFTNQQNTNTILEAPVILPY